MFWIISHRDRFIQRIILAIASLHYMSFCIREPARFFVASHAYLIGWTAYQLGISSNPTCFGAILNMITNRCTTACLLVLLSSARPWWALLFQGPTIYISTYATLAMGGSEQSQRKDRSKTEVVYCICIITIRYERLDYPCCIR